MDAGTVDGIEPPACVMVDLDALVRSLNEDGTAAADTDGGQDDVGAMATATAEPAETSSDGEATATPTVEVPTATPQPTATHTPVTPPTSAARDPCAVMPAGGDFGTVNEGRCFATFGGGPGARRVQIDLLPPAATGTTICESMAEDSDFHTVMGSVSIGECGFRNDSNYQGEKVPGYTGWAIRFYRDRFVVRVSTDEEYPTDQAWIESTAGTVDISIRESFGEGTP
jgi:hypothetical protein